LPEIIIESVKKIRERAKIEEMTVFTKKFINFLFLHITGQEFNTILVSCCTLKKKILFSRLLKKDIYFEK